MNPITTQELLEARDGARQTRASDQFESVAREYASMALMQIRKALKECAEGGNSRIDLSLDVHVDEPLQRRAVTQRAVELIRENTTETIQAEIYQRRNDIRVRINLEPKRRED